MSTAVAFAVFVVVFAASAVHSAVAEAPGGPDWASLSREVDDALGREARDRGVWVIDVSLSPSEQT